MFTSHDLVNTILIGVGATAVLDLWLAILKRFGVPIGSFALIGRWVAHMCRGTFCHRSIAKAEPVGNELTIGWVTHYAVGIVFAAVLMALQGSAWVESPTFFPAFLTGAVTVVMPLFVMQPAMGSPPTAPPALRTTSSASGRQAGSPPGWWRSPLSSSWRRSRIGWSVLWSLVTETNLEFAYRPLTGASHAFSQIKEIAMSSTRAAVGTTNAFKAQSVRYLWAGLRDQ